jgi:sugar phosphate isomerase/epimerase
MENSTGKNFRILFKKHYFYKSIKITNSVLLFLSQRSYLNIHLMNKLSRRQFITTGALGIGSAVIASQMPLEFKTNSSNRIVIPPLGFQVWTIREQLVKDFPGTLKMMADLGYKTVEMCSPPGYQFAGFAPLMKMTAKEMRQIISDAGLTLESTHYGMGEFRDNLQDRIQFAAESGQKQMILSSFGLSDKATSSDWMKAADELNKFGMEAKKAGIQMGFHNHHGEFGEVDGTLIYDILMKQFDPEYVKMQFQVAVISIGYKAATYFEKYPGRFISAHLADWSATEKKEAPIGKGIVDWKEFFNSLEKGGVKNIFVEMSPETFKDSAIFIQSL